MSTRIRAAVAALVLAVAASFAGNLAAAPVYGAPRPQPDIVLIVTDDQRWDTLWAMPTVQRELVRHGVAFSNAFVANPLCCPSRVSILTGRFSHSTGVYGNNPPFGGFSAFHDRSTVATWMKAAGYATGYVGKYLNGTPPTYVPPGWDRWVSFASAPAFFRFDLNVDGAVKPYRAQPRAYSTDVLADEATDFIERSDGTPFFLVFAPYAPHHPATPAPRHARTFMRLAAARPPSYDERDVGDKPHWLRAQPRLSGRERRALDGFRRSQYASLLAVDDAVDRIVSTLRHAHRLHDVAIIFTSDNGLLWGEHRIPRAKWAPYEQSIRIPLVIRYDDVLANPRADAHLVENIDLAPTIADLTGAVTDRVDGRSLVPLLEAGREPWRTSLLVEHLLSGPPRLAQPVPTYCAVRTRRFKYVAYATHEEELYDLMSDPYERENVRSARRYRDRLLAMRKRLKAQCSPPPPGFTTAWISTRGGPFRAGRIAPLQLVAVRTPVDTAELENLVDVFAGLGELDPVTVRDPLVDVSLPGVVRGESEPLVAVFPE